MAAAICLLLGLDFDGTLAPLARSPQRARMGEGIRSLLRRLALRPRVRVAVVSGRALDDVKAKVGLSRIYYVGNHGLEIEGPGVRWTHPRAKGVSRSMQRAAVSIERLLRDFPGSFLENKHYTLSVHYRELSSRCSVRELRRRLMAALRSCREPLRLARGNKVWELRPRFRWDKGSAMVELQRRLPGRCLKVFVGDDRTDEEAFNTLGARAVTVRIAGSGGDPGSAALFGLRSQAEIEPFLATILRTVR